MPRNRKDEMHVCFSPRERQLLRSYSEKTGWKQSQIVRLLVNGAILREAPPAIDREALRALHAILNKIGDIEMSIRWLGEEAAGENYDRKLLGATALALCEAVTGIETAIYRDGEKMDMRRLMDKIAELPPTMMEETYRLWHPDFTGFVTQTVIQNPLPLEGSGQEE